MNFKTTLILLVFVACAAALFYFSPPVHSLFYAEPAASEAGTRAVLEKLKPGDLTRIELNYGSHHTTFTRDGNVWTLPGNWPVRTDEADALAELLGNLRSRFDAVPIQSDTDLSPYGLANPAVTLKLSTGSAIYQFALGESPATTEPSQFTRSTYLRLLSGPANDKPAPEVLRMGPGLLALLDHPTDYYQQRRLFPSERAAKENEPQAKAHRLNARGVRIEMNKKAATEDAKQETTVFSVERNPKDQSWELAAPERDRLDPRTAEALLTALPDVWAEKFVTADLKEAGLTEPERTIIVERDNGAKMTLLIGKSSRRATKTIMRAPPPGLPGVPPIPRPETITEEFLYAKLADNAQVFEIKANALKDVFVGLDALRDARLARFDWPDATEVEIAQPGQAPIQMVKEKERWKLVKPLQADADVEKVTDLLQKLASLEARGPDTVPADKHDDAAQGFDKPGTTVTIKWETDKKSGDKDSGKVAHSTTLKFGKDDAEKKKLYVKADDWPRVNLVEDSLLPLVQRPALAYRGKRLLDFAVADIEKIDVQRGEKTLSLQQDADGWKLLAPVVSKVDAAKVNLLADTLGRLEVLEYVDDEPKEDKLDPEYGVDKSAALIVTVSFNDKSKPARTLRLGKVRGGKPGYFGKMADGTPVFALDEGIYKLLDRDSLAYLPLELWQLKPDDIASIRINKEGRDDYTLKRDGEKWQVTGPFDAPAMPALVEPLLASLAAAHCESYKAHEAKELGVYGLDKPELTLTVQGKENTTHTLLIGKSAEDGDQLRYARLADKPGICVVGEQLIAVADHPALDLLDPVLLRLDPGKIERITSKSGETTLTLERKADDWQVLNTPASPFAADNQAMTMMQFLWANLRARKFAAYGDKTDWAKYGLDKPSAVVTVAVKEGEPKEHVVELGAFVEGTSGPRYARVDKGQGVAVLTENVAKTLAQSYLDFVNRSVLQFKADDATAIVREMGKETLEIAKRDDAWQIAKPAEQRADDKSLQELLGQLADLRAVRVVAFPATELKSYGLDKPDAEVTIKLKADAKHVIKIGKPAEADGTERYAVVGDSKAVVVLPAAVSKRLVAAPITYRDRAIARFADADKLRLERGPRQAVFARVEGSWKMTEPLTADADSDELDEFLNTLARLRADELVAEKPSAAELKTYGLDKPEARWKLTAGDKEVLQLVIGAREKVGVRRYAQLGGSDIVFLLDPKLSQRSVAEFRKRDVWATPLDAVQIEAVRFGYAKNPFVLARKNETEWQIEGKPDLKPNTATVNETLAALAGLKLSRYVVDKRADFKLFGLEPPELVLEVATPTGKRTLHIGRPEGESKRLYARIADANRSDVFVIDEADAAKIVREAAAFSKVPARPDLP